MSLIFDFSTHGIGLPLQRALTLPSYMDDSDPLLDIEYADDATTHTKDYIAVSIEEDSEVVLSEIFEEKRMRLDSLCDENTTLLKCEQGTKMKSSSISNSSTSETLVEESPSTTVAIPELPSCDDSPSIRNESCQARVEAAGNSKCIFPKIEIMYIYILK